MKNKQTIKGNAVHQAGQVLPARADKSWFMADFGYAMGFIEQDGREVLTISSPDALLDAYVIGGNSYFKLRDLCAAFDAFVGRDGAAGTVRIDITKGNVVK